MIYRLTTLGGVVWVPDPAEPEIAAEWRAIADRIEALLPRIPPVERFAPSIVVDAYRAKAARLERVNG